MKVKTPSGFGEVKQDHKKQWIKNQKETKILNENKILLKKMLQIDKHPQSLNPTNIKVGPSPSTASLNKKNRYDRWVDIIKENKRILDKLNRVKSHYDVESQLYS
mmetsp:Transcript_16109/g.35367  ORF Transcript_16109/g.35367 Transcript_16109/m.35367 type:complete len:105 (+) Transcript_16109:122-436(+)|eukprot:CAMPEP_0116931096 /NCGR_PEP_ID=MMETSP0467-20121206/27606_1 /TAXON_ID=283647 /ORGANISM="Mesodinium pulex, Strain SPMC105" /LENGTH=104 /DNA_ID=CAMNT_0004611457 /DNA_START=99 /DNA_END=413 /DNA_ORIENTATION=+